MNIASLFTAIATLAWIGFVAVIVLVFLGASRGRPVRGGTTIIAVVAVVAIIASIFGAGMVYIRPEEAGVVLSMVAPNGYREQSLSSGIHFIIPFAESVVRYPISKQTYTMSIASTEGQLEGDDSITARTADGQQINVDASVIYAVDPTQIVRVHIEWQDRYEDNLVRPISRGVIRDIVSQYGVEEVVSSKRVEMTEQMSKGVAEKLRQNGLVMIDFVLRNLTFSDEYAVSVEQKQISEQQAQQAKFVVEQRRQEADQAREVAKGQADAQITRAKGEAESRIIQAEAEAKALRMVADVLKDNSDLLTYQYITKLSPNVQIMMVPSGSPFLFTMPQYGPAVPTTTSTDPAPPATTTTEDPATETQETNP